MKLRNVAAGTGAALAGYALVLRPRHLRWGATDEEIARAMPLDGHVPQPTYVTNRAVTNRVARHHTGGGAGGMIRP